MYKEWSNPLAEKEVHLLDSFARSSPTKARDPAQGLSQRLSQKLQPVEATAVSQQAQG